MPYIIMMIFCGMPMMFLEFAFGQYGRLGVVSIWKACPIFQGKANKTPGRHALYSKVCMVRLIKHSASGRHALYSKVRQTKHLEGMPYIP